jgi:hypothetical protein
MSDNFILYKKTSISQHEMLWRKVVIINNKKAFSTQARFLFLGHAGELRVIIALREIEFVTETG